LEAQLQKLHDEVVRVKQQRKRELMQLRDTRDQEAVVMQSNFDSQVTAINALSYLSYLAFSTQASKVGE